MGILGFDRKLSSLEPDNKVYVSGKGSYQVQLEVPSDSRLTPYNVERIVAIALWQGGRIDDKVEGYEGGRSVLITRDRPHVRKGVELLGLQISGVGYQDFEGLGTLGVYTSGTDMHPPTTANFLDRFIGTDGMTTTVVKDGDLVAQRQEYSPLGAYTEQRIRHKVANTRLADSLPVNFSVPDVEAYGRYFKLRHDDQHLGFIVFTVPSARHQRFAQQCFEEAVNKRLEVQRFLEYVKRAMDVVGTGLRELHQAGYVHRQPHPSNFYFLEGDKPHSDRIHLMDWSTLIPLVEDSITHRAVDLRIVHQHLEALLKTIYPTVPPLASIDIIDRLTNSYLQSPHYRTVSVFRIFKQMDNERKSRKDPKDVSDFDAIREAIRRELSRS